MDKIVWGSAILGAGVLCMTIMYLISSLPFVVTETQGFPQARLELEKAVPDIPTMTPEPTPSSEPKEHRCISLLVGLDTKTAKDCFAEDYSACTYWFLKKAREVEDMTTYSTKYYQIAIGCASKYDVNVAKKIDKYHEVYEVCINGEVCWTTARGTKQDFVGRPELDALLEELFSVL